MYNNCKVLIMYDDEFPLKKKINIKHVKNSIVFQCINEKEVEKIESSTCFIFVSSVKIQEKI